MCVWIYLHYVCFFYDVTLTCIILGCTLISHHLPTLVLNHLHLMKHHLPTAGLTMSLQV